MRLLAVCPVILPLALCLAMQVQASEPGQPLDCSDWVSVEPGFTCSVFLAYPTTSPYGDFTEDSAKEPDNEGNVLRVTRVFDEFDSSCNQALWRTELLRFDGRTERIVGYFKERCSSLEDKDGIFPRYNTTGNGSDQREETLKFDGMAGAVLLPLQVNSAAFDYATGHWVASISGFATTLEILQTFSPDRSALAFRVPYIPEGFPAADWFDTYYGDLATVGDWSQAQPLQCEYPATAPDVGDYLTVADPLPDPEPGSGRYYVTAVTHQGQRRFGRQQIGGVLSGRDPAALPVCD